MSVRRYKSSGWQRFGPSISSFAEIPPQTLDYVKAQFPEVANPLGFVRASWRSAWEAGRWIDTYGAVTFPLMGERGNGCVGVLKPNLYDGKPWWLTYVGPDSYGALDRIRRKSPVPPALYDLAIVDWGELFQAAEMALPEPWGFAGGDVSVFTSYVMQTYARLVSEGKVRVDERRCFLAFNSGLATPGGDDVLIAFERPSRAVPEWRYAGACVVGAGPLGERIAEAFDEPLLRACYVGDATEMAYDGTCGITVDYRHIVGERLWRFPMAYLERLLRGREELLGAVRAAGGAGGEQGDGVLDRVAQAVWDDAALHAAACADLEAAVSRAVRMAGREKGVAVPMFHPNRQSSCLLLPLCMARADTPDLALVVCREEGGGYRAVTVLDLRAAYMDARLIGRPGASWLGV